jgi:hypothetical protein
MTLSPVIRRALHLFLVAALILPGSLWPARATVSLVDSATVAAAIDMPCGKAMPAPSKSHDGQPCEDGCCPQPTCDLSACVGTGVLPQLASLPSVLPPVPLVFSWRITPPPSQLLDTPLRPPII